MLFSRAKNIVYDQLRLSVVNGSCIERVTEYKYLGLWLDEHFSFKFHVNNLMLKLRQKLGFLYRNKTSFPIFCRKWIIQAVFLSVLDYGDIIYRHAAATTMRPLDSVYHSALRFITGDSYGTHHCTLYKKVGWTSLSDRRKYHWCLYIF